MTTAPRQMSTIGLSTEPMIIGLYGVPGAGKSHLLKQLREQLQHSRFAFFEGKDLIEEVTDGGLEAFKTLDSTNQDKMRSEAIEACVKQCNESDKTGIVTGHLMFWKEGEAEPKDVWTEADALAYTHLLYLDVPAATVFQRQRDDETRPDRLKCSAKHIENWQSAEKDRLREVCRDQGILFAALKPHALGKTADFIAAFRERDGTKNLLNAERKLDSIMRSYQTKPTTVLMLDADKTLAAEDASVLFWEKAGSELTPLEKVFRQMHYSYPAFVQAMLLYEEFDKDEYEARCEKAADKIAIHSQFADLFGQLDQHPHVAAIVVTSGIAQVWEEVIKRAGFSSQVKVVGGSRLADQFVVTPVVKGALLKRLQTVHEAYVWAFGDSAVDLAMLKRADQAIVVVGPQPHRSKSMDTALQHAIDIDGLQARQVLLPPSAPPCLTPRTLPLARLETLHASLFDPLDLIEATATPAALLLQTPMRDAAASAPALRNVHARCGWYLAVHHVARVLGTEPFTIRSVQDTHTEGFRLRHEAQTLIIPLLRGGEPMAFGVAGAFPRAVFLHAREAEEVEARHLEGMEAVILVDAVINEGGSVAGFVRRVRGLKPGVRVVVVAGVVQREAVCGPERFLVRKLGGCGRVTVVTLRTSGNKFVGRGRTDTGDRLFNTTHLA